MTAPTPAAPTTWKSWVALIGGLIGSLGPVIAQMAGVVPAPWGAILTGIGGVIALFTKQAVWQTPYKPPNTELVTVPPAPPNSSYTNPWKTS